RREAGGNASRRGSRNKVDQGSGEMRWNWIDRYIEFESGRRAKAIKCISLAEDHMLDHFPNYPVIPNSLVVEGLAQTAGLLLCEHGDFKEKVVLAKVPKLRFHCEAVPGDRLIYTVEIQYIKPEGARVTVSSHKDDILHAEGEIMFAHLDEPRLASLFEPHGLLQMMRLLRAFDVGKAKDGSPLKPPRWLVEAAGEGTAGKGA
ncbi:MAG TPA: 3-hydroxyacyl-ACP dehydratase FabZ family protein, partial [Opitutales bacterium]|nr:3-hydroxyacyl-ACP dehydratase FabZ family protein [Opitutales bacterium]